MSPALASPPAAVPTTPTAIRSTERVLFALSAEEQRLFFPAGLPVGVNGFALDTTPLDSARDWPARLAEFRPTVLVTCWATPALPAAFLDDPACPLRYVCHLAGAVRQLVPRPFLERGGLVSNWGGVVAPEVAEHALLLILGALRNIPAWRPYLETPRARTAASAPEVIATRSLHGLRVGLHGYGRVARALLPLLRPFGVTVSACSHGVPPALMITDDVRPVADLGDLCASSDVLVECEALTERSAGSLDAAALARLPDGAVVVSVGRGRVVDEPALLAEARSDRLRVAIDVAQREPIPPDSPLLATPGLLHSPHIAGPTLTGFAACGRQALANLHRHLGGEPLSSIVTLEIYDRAT